MKFILVLSVFAVAAFALPVDFTIPPLSDEQKAAEENPDAFKAAVVKAFNNIPESVKQQFMNLHVEVSPNKEVF